MHENSRLLVWIVFMMIKANLTGMAAEETNELAVFSLNEVSATATEHIDHLGVRVRPGQEALCRTEPDVDVKAYPSFTSNRPLFGKVNFARNDPALGIVTGLWATTRKREPSSTRRFHLEPIDGTVEIFDSSGSNRYSHDQKFFFGGGDEFSFRWHIPADLKLSGRREVFTLKVRLNTADLYGVVTGTTTIAMEVP